MSKTEYKLITFNEFAEYLGTLDSDHICPMCSCEAWTLSTPFELSPDDSEKKMVPTIPGTFFHKSPTEKRKDLYSTTALDLLLMQCQNCGYMNFFNYRKVELNITTGSYTKRVEEEDSNDKDS